MVGEVPASCVIYEQTHQENKETTQPQALSMVSEPEYEYGAEAFEAYMDKHGTKETVSMPYKEIKIGGQKR